jgi:hypothetical protein
LAFLQIKRRFGPWLLGLFLIAQIAGVGPLMFGHTVHLLESQLAAVDAHERGAPDRHGGHRHGVADVQDECCALHHQLTGVIPVTIPDGGLAPAAMPWVAPPLRALVNVDPILLERPPKFSSPI